MHVVRVDVQLRENSCSSFLANVCGKRGFRIMSLLHDNPHNLPPPHPHTGIARSQ
jgi:hypothetical protein